MLDEPFDPFTMMIERPIPRVGNLSAPTTPPPTVEEEGELEEGEEENLKTIISIQKDKEIDREEILERLRKNKIWITYLIGFIIYTFRI